MLSADAEAALAYHEPSIVVILGQSSFFLLLNVSNWALDALLYCGLIGQILVGIAWGTPGGQILSLDAEHVVVQLGYLGLILLVFEGGLSTSFPSLKANIALSLVVAGTGIGAPIGLSFILASLVGASSLQCFAAGAALCSTSLGTTFVVLRASGLASTRLGVILTSAAMLDDVVGLVMVQVISNLGGSEATVSAVTVVRPVLVSVAFVAVAIVLCRFVAKPVTVILNNWRMAHDGTRLNELLARRATALVLHTALLVALVSASSYAGTSNLFAAYIAGAAISWWDSEVPHPVKPAEQSQGVATKKLDGATRQPDRDDAAASSRSPSNPVPTSSAYPSLYIFEHYYHSAVKCVLQPFFFASIGFSIPITKMFTGSIIWKGVVYTILMIIAKLMCGLWLVRFPGAVVWFRSMIKSQVLDVRKTSQPLSTPVKEPDQTTSPAGQGETWTSSAPPTSPATKTANRGNNVASPASTPMATAAQGQFSGAGSRNTIPSPPKPLSLYPASILGLAMVPRGEIGFLISSIARSNGVFGSGQDSGESEIFLITTWAIVLCTMIGPLCVGLLVRRVKKLEKNAMSSARREGDASCRNALGVWGV